MGGSGSQRGRLEMASYLWRKYADYVYTKWERILIWDMIEPHRRPKSFTPLVSIYVAAFYTGVIAAAINEQLYKVDSNSNSCFFIHLLQSCIFILTLSNIDLELMVF